MKAAVSITASRLSLPDTAKPIISSVSAVRNTSTIRVHHGHDGMDLSS